MASSGREEWTSSEEYHGVVFFVSIFKPSRKDASVVSLGEDFHDRLVHLSTVRS